MRPWLACCACILAAAAALSQATLVAAAGFGVSPGTLEFALEEGTVASRQLSLYNLGSQAQFTAVSSNPGLVQVSQESGTIAAGSAATITVTASAAAAKKGRHSEAITVTMGSNQENEIRLAIGTVVPVTITITNTIAAANAAIGLAVSAGIVATGLFVYSPLARRLPGRA